MLGLLMIGFAAVGFAGHFWLKPEEAPEEKVVGTGVVEQVIGSQNEGVRYTVRFTGERNRSYVAKTAAYTGRTLEVGNLVHIRRWFGKKGRPGAEIIHPELTRIPDRSKNASFWCLVLSPALLALGILLLAI